MMQRMDRFPITKIALYSLLLLCLANQAFAVTKNSFDDRTFQALTLNNGLKVLLISDPSSSYAAASLDVLAGFGDDPEARPGLAHLLEHMLLVRSEKYSTPHQFQTFVQQHAGEVNAYTSVSHTNYYFDLHPNKLNTALDRFAQMFIAPVFESADVQNEVAAIHTEFLAFKDADDRRELDVLREFITAQHPLAKFSTGNQETLQTSENSPQDLLQSLNQFFIQHYSADQMVLVVSSPGSIDSMNKLIVEKFSVIAKREVADVENMKPTAPSTLFVADVLGKTVEIKSAKDIRKLSLYFPVTNSDGLYSEKPLDYLAHIVGYEGKGSLHSLFARLGWITALNVTSRYAWQKGEVFAIDIHLTDAGLAQVDTIKQLVYEYLDMLNDDGVTQWRYNELAMLGKMEFNFYEKTESVATVSQLARALHTISPEHILSANYLFDNYDELIIRSFSSQLRAENSLAVIAHPHVIAQHNSQYYDVGYAFSKNESTSPAMHRKQWRAYRKQLNLPQENEFLVKDFRLVTHKEEAADWRVPHKINEKHGVSTWFLPDRKFKQPKSYVFSRWLMPRASESARHVVATQLMVNLIEQAVNENIYDARIAGLEFSINHNERGMELSFSGYSDTLPKLVKDVMTVVDGAINSRRTQRKLTKRYFFSEHESLLHQQQNRSFDRAYLQAYREVPAILYNPLWSDESVLNALLAMNEKEFLKITRDLFNGAKAEVFVYGNENQKSAQRLADYWVTIQKRSDSQPKVSPALVIDISEERHIYIKSLPLSQTDNALILYVQGHSDSLKERAMFLLFDQMLRAPFYNYLRTEEQLGYVVQSSYYKIKNVPGLVCVVQSPNATPNVLYDTINEFFVERGEALFENFHQDRKTVVRQLNQNPRSAMEVALHFWSSIVEGDHQFNQQEKLRELVAELSQYQMQNFYFSRVLNKTGRVLFVGNNSEITAESFEKNALMITDADWFKKSMPVYLYP